MIKDCIKYISKRLLVTVVILISLLGIYLVRDIFINPILVKGYQTTDNTMGTYSMQIDYDHYYHDNIINCNSTSTVSASWSATRICYTRIENNSTYNISMTFNKKGGSGNGGLAVFLSKDIPDMSLSNWFPDILDGYNRIHVEESQNANWSSTFNSENYNYIAIYNGRTSDDSQGTINNIKIMVSTSSVDEYHSFFKLGYNMGYSFFVKNSSSNEINTDITISDTANNLYFKNSCTIPGNSINYQCYSGNIFYLPFQYTKDYYIYFNYNLKISFSNSNISIASPTDSGYTFTFAQFNATTTDGTVAQLKMKRNYIYNSIMYTGFNVSLNNNNGSTGKVILARNEYTGDNNYTYDTNSGAINIMSDYTSETYMNDTLTNERLFGTPFGFMNQFVISLNSEYISNTELSISIGSVNLGIQNSNTTSTILNNGSDNYEQYNTCSAWYDIPCQLANGATYVMYNLPVMSPLIQLISGMIIVIYNIVTMIKWYEGLGILFSLFIFILMIRILIMLLKGSNDDRGGKK